LRQGRGGRRVPRGPAAEGPVAENWTTDEKTVRRRTLVPDVAEIESKVKKIVSEQMNVAETEITRETSFVNDLNADSLDTVELVMEFEEEFELNIPDEEAEKIQTVGQAIDFIKAHLESASK
jgi:acyl carrier protein